MIEDSCKQERTQGKQKVWFFPGSIVWHGNEAAHTMGSCHQCQTHACAAYCAFCDKAPSFKGSWRQWFFYDAQSYSVLYGPTRIQKLRFCQDLQTQWDLVDGSLETLSIKERLRQSEWSKYWNVDNFNAPDIQLFLISYQYVEGGCCRWPLGRHPVVLGHVQVCVKPATCKFVVATMGSW